MRLVPLPPPPLTAAVWGRLLGLNPEGESLTAEPCGGQNGSEGRADLGCLVAVSWSVSVLPKASPDPPRRCAPEGYDCVSGEDLGWGRGKAEDTDRRVIN